MEHYEFTPFIESISGANYVFHLREFFNNSYQGQKKEKKYNCWRDKFMSLLIKEAALTRITIIDERLFNAVEWVSIKNYEEGTPIKGTSIELDLKNIQVLNYFRINDNNDNNDYTYETGNRRFRGNKYRSCCSDVETERITPHFISIHLGIIEKIIEDNNMDFTKANVNEVVKGVFSDLGITEIDRVRLVFHTGRGSLSNNARMALEDEYSIIPLSSLRSAFYDSKYMLSQLFYNIRYK